MGVVVFENCGDCSGDICIECPKRRSIKPTDVAVMTIKKSTYDKMVLALMNSADMFDKYVEIHSKKLSNEFHPLNSREWEETHKKIKRNLEMAQMCRDALKR